MRRLAIVYIKQPFVDVIVQLSSMSRLSIVYIKQPLLFLSFNYPQRAVYIVYMKPQRVVVFIVQLSSRCRLHCLH